MANFTERAIKEAFLNLLNERPLNKITVKDITDSCGINRNSFYYHFQDIPSLIQEIFTSEINRIIEEYSSIGSLQQAVDVSCSMLLQNRRAILHIYNSVNRGLFEQYFWQVCGHTVNIYMNSVFPDLDIASSDLKYIKEYYQCSIFGLISGWLQKGMSEDISPMLNRLFQLRKGFPEEMIRRCREN